MSSHRDVQEMVAQFHAKFGLCTPKRDGPRVPSRESPHVMSAATRRFRADFLLEEVREFVHAAGFMF